MSAGYRAIGWNRQKTLYDLTFLAGLVLYLTLFLGVGALIRPEATLETLLIRAFGTAALLLLHVVLSIGPLCRLDPRLLPLLYNRRHLGVATFVMSAAHAVFSLVQFHALGNVNPLVSLLSANPRYDSLSQFPFEIPGLIALAILFCMAATSHDFWLANLTAPVWKALHMAVYLAYGLIVLHVALGVLQAETSPWLVGTLGVGLVWILGLHVTSGLGELPDDRETRRPVADDGFVEVCRVDELRENRGRSFCIGGERVAVFKYDGRISALSGVCQHQGGPLGEGRIRDGCVTCPWHGYQYRPDTGASPPPFTEAVPVFRVRVVGDRVLVHPRPEAAGTFVAPAVIRDHEVRAETAASDPDDFYVGYLPRLPRALAGRVRMAVLCAAVASVTVALILVSSQSRFDPGIFEYGVSRKLEGIVRERPYPMLHVERPGSSDAAARTSAYALVAPGKHGAGSIVAGLDGRKVELSGALVYRSGRTMVEVEPASLRELAAPDTDGPRARRELGVRTLAGEIVDSKCYLGVMKPGRSKPHRACAARCISGGIPPLFIVRDEDGYAEPYLLVSAHGEPVNEAVIDFVAEPIEITGRVVRDGELWILEADPRDYRRLP